MLTTLTSRRLSWPLRATLVLGALAVCAVPLVSLTRSAAAQDEKKQAAEVERDWTRPEFLPRPSKHEEQIHSALEEPTKLEVIDMPLKDVADFLADYHEDLAIQVDRKALEDVGLGDDTPMTLNVAGIPLRSALRLLLAPHDLVAVVQDNVLLITTPDKADSMLITRTYPVTDLIDSQDKASYELLVKAITSTVGPQTWHEVGGPGSITVVPKAGSAVISQTRAVHDEILELLRALRTARDLSEQ